MGNMFFRSQCTNSLVSTNHKDDQHRSELVSKEVGEDNSELCSESLQVKYALMLPWIPAATIICYQIFQLTISVNDYVYIFMHCDGL